MTDPTARSCRVNEIEAIHISLASPDDIRSWSSGEVTKATGFDASDGPIAGGLFCEAIFGPLQEWRCQCGKRFGEEQKNQYCDVCDHFPSFQPRPQTHMGHIELACPVVHPLFYAAFSPLLCQLLDIPKARLRQLVQYHAHLVIDAGQTSLKHYQIVTDQQVRQMRDDLGDSQLQTLSGAEAVRRLIEGLDLDELASKLRQQRLHTDSEQKQANLQRRLHVVESLRASGNNPSWMVLDVLPVVPPYMRSRQTQGAGVTECDLNTRYRRVLNRNDKMRRALKMDLPEVIVRDCKFRLQWVVDRLFDDIANASQNSPDKIAASLVRKLQHDLRTSFPLGKSVDFSGRSVVVPNSQLRLDQCGLPRSLALTLYEPLIIRYLLARKHAQTSYYARILLARKSEVVWEALENLLREHWVLLSRPPIVKRQRIQAFQPRLVGGNAIHIHPLIGQQFGVEFSGEQLKVYLPLSIEAQTEARRLVSSANNLFDAQADQFALIPENDVLLGCHYLTIAKTGCRGEGMVFSSPDEAVTAWEHGRIDLHAVVRVRLAAGKRSQTGTSDWVTDSASDSNRIIDTTLGRVLFNDVLPQEMDYYDHELDRTLLLCVISDCFREVGRERTMDVLQSITRLAQQHLTSSGLSLGIQDLPVPSTKANHINHAEKVRTHCLKWLERGYLTSNESYYKQLDAWVSAREQINQDLTRELTAGANILSLLAKTSERGNVIRYDKLCGMCGIACNPHEGRIRPIRTNLREGLQITDYWNHLLIDRPSSLTHRERHLNRSNWEKLSSLLQGIVITMEDCETQHGVTILPFYDGDVVRQSLLRQAYGRVALETIVDPVTSEIVVAANELVTYKIVKKLERIGFKSLQVRSPMTCEASNGLCQRCYGMDYSAQELVEMGAAVGVHAVFAISGALARVGKPPESPSKMDNGVPVPLDYDTFEEYRRSLHDGYAAGETVEVHARQDGTIDLTNVDVADGRVLNHGGRLQLLDSRRSVVESYPLPHGATLRVEHGKSVIRHQSVFEFEASVAYVIARSCGIATFHLDGEDAANTWVDNERLVIQKDDLPRHPRIVISDDSGAALEVHYLGVGFRVCNSVVWSIGPAKVFPGNVLATAAPRNVASIGLSPFQKRQKLMGLLEAWNTWDCMTLAPADAKVVEVERQMSGSHHILLSTADGRLLQERVWMNPRVFPGDEVRAGDPLTDGTPSPFDVLKYGGVSKVIDYLKRQIKGILIRDRINLADQHIELAISRLLSRAKVIDAGDSQLVVGTTVERSRLRSVNHELSNQCRVTDCGDSSLQVGELVSTDVFEQAREKVRQNGGQLPESTAAEPVIGETILLGMTKASIGLGDFLTEARFRELRSVFANAAWAGESDDLNSLDSNVILGRLIPAGTGQRALRDAKVLVSPSASPQEPTFPLTLEESSPLLGDPGSLDEE
ncbi:MAG: hypothetical protein R3C20_15395 [Planctomycetaceae bacterium]